MNLRLCRIIFCGLAIFLLPLGPLGQPLGAEKSDPFDGKLDIIARSQKSRPRHKTQSSKTPPMVPTEFHRGSFLNKNSAIFNPLAPEMHPLALQKMPLREQDCGLPWAIFDGNLEQRWNIGAQFKENSHALPSRGKVREELLQAVDRQWLPATAKVAGEEKPPAAPINPLEQKLRTVIIPKVCFLDVPLHDAIDSLAELSETLDVSGNSGGINILVLDSPDDNLRLHFTLRDSSLEKIIQYIAQAAGYDYDLDGNAVVLTSAAKNQQRLQTELLPISRGAVVRLTNLREEGKNGPTHQEQLGREEELLRDFLQRAGVDFQRIPGSSLAFDGSQLIVTQTPLNLKRVGNILSYYQSLKQVEIETKFLEVQQGLLDELQFRWTISHGQNADGSVKDQAGTGRGIHDNLRSLTQAFLPQQTASGDGSIVLDTYDGTNLNNDNPFPTGSKTIAIPNRAPMIPNTSNLAQGSVPLVDVLGVINGTKVGFMLKALEQESGSDLMSAPKLTVLSGKTAEIVVAQELRYPEEYDEIQSSVGNGSSLNSASSAGVTITAGTPRNFKTRNVGVEMSVTPIVENDDRISLQLAPSVTEFEGFVEYGGVSVAVAGGATVTVPSGFFQPIFSTRRIQTEVTIENGATVVMGGLTREEVKLVRDKVPFLGDIPILGHLFRSRGKSSQKRNLLIFVTAKLVDPRGCEGMSGEIVRIRPGEAVHSKHKKENSRAHH